MAIRPWDALSKEEEKKTILEKIEGTIDQILLEDFDSRDKTVFIGLDVFEGVSKTARENILSWYKPDWDIEYHSDEKDGDYYEFKAAEVGLFHPMRRYR